MTFGNAALRHGLSLIVFLKWIDYSNSPVIQDLVYKDSFSANISTMQWDYMIKGGKHSTIEWSFNCKYV